MSDDLDAILRPFCSWHPETQTWRLFIVRDGRPGERSDVAKLTFEPVGRHGPAAPTLELGDGPMRAVLQGLVNEAAKLGILPNDAATTVAATRARLADMRALVAKAYDTRLP